MASDPTQFSYHPTKDGRLRVAFRGRHVITLSGGKAQRQASRLEGADADQTQLCWPRPRATPNAATSVNRLTAWPRSSKPV